MITRYGKWDGLDLDHFDLEKLLEKLSDFFLQSGFSYGGWSRRIQEPDQSLEALREAIRELLRSSDLLAAAERRALQDESGGWDEKKLDELVDALIQRLLEQGYLRAKPDERRSNAPRLGQGRIEEDAGARVKFELTEKGTDFLGYKALSELLGALGKGYAGRHDTHHLSTGVEAFQSSKPYEFGDTLNLDVNATLLSAIRRNGLGVPLNVEYSDLMVHQSEYASSCATVLMLDCSHSMILYGEDRFTPAKRVALALTHLIRTQYPGDTLKLVLFHDSAEEVPIAKLAQLTVGPYHTNTAEGLKLARRILLAQRVDMRQIIMITDGKPSALTMEDGRIYKNSMGLDPMIMEATYKEVAKCRRSNIAINTFMLADDPYLVNFIKQVTHIAQGKAYFTTVMTLGQYVMMDFLRRKRKKVR
ncbi:MAG: VWA domain-containing protein [Chloracidobacterium sp.]|nr:VWA domain-containing protein [Chloracidobacterium sp.]MDW8218792.1 VWA domain-containing protein [Acidobacteriota bacterium]